MSIENVCCPPGFKPQYTTYPEGLTIYEALCNWLESLNEVIDTVNELVIEVEEKVSKQQLNEDYQLFAVDEQVSGYANYTGAWQGVTDPALSDPGIAGQVILNRDNIEDLQIVTESNVNRLDFLESLEFLDVTAYGVDNTGATEISTALQPLLDLALTRDGLNIYFPSGTYYCSEFMIVHSNTYWKASPSATFFKDINSNEGRIVGMGSLATEGGYGAGGTNVVFEGGRYEGFSDLNIGNSFSLHHVENAIFRDMVFYKAIYEGHALDLIGCKNVLVDNCRFEGFQVIAGREFTEAIQLDVSVLGAGANIGNYYDGLPTINTTIQNCYCKPVYDNVGGIVYPAPNLTGMHTNTSIKYENIKVVNNTTENGHTRQSGTTSAWFRFRAVKNLTVTNNTFYSTFSNNNSIILVDTSNTAKDTDGTNYPLTIRSENINISDNTFYGFDNDNFNVVNNVLISIRGSVSNSTTYYVENTIITNNVAKDSKRVTLVGLFNVNNVNISGNSGWDIGSICYCDGGTTNSFRVSVTNNIVTICNNNPFQIIESGMSTVANNEVNNCTGGNFIKNCTGVCFNGNVLVGFVDSGSFTSVLRFDGCTGITFSNNITRNRSSTYNLRVNANCDDLIVNANIGDVLIEGSPTNSYVAGNISE